MLSILYHDCIGNAQNSINLRIDPIGNGYILRATTILIEGKQYVLPTDFSFPYMTDLRANFWTKDGKTLRLTVYEAKLVPVYQNDSAVMEHLHADLGTFVNIPFHEVGAHYDKKTKSQSGSQIVVHRIIPPGVTPADKNPLPNPALPLVEAYMESNSPELSGKVRASLQAHNSTPLVTARQKTWAELNDVERAAVNQKMAEHLGLVKTA